MKYLIGILFCAQAFGASIFEDYGQIENRFPLDFNRDTLGVSRDRVYFQNADGTIGGEKRFFPITRTCMDTITFNGNEVDGTVSVAAKTIWSKDFSESGVCEQNSGTYTYHVTDDGMWLTGSHGTVWMFFK